jgi:hypothetical protein
VDFYEDFVRFLTFTIQFSRKPNNDKDDSNVKIGYEENSIGNRIKNIKVFMNNALDKGYTTNRRHLHGNFKKLKKTADTINLNEKELEIL